MEAHTLTRASAHAWLRLRDEGVVELSHASDADAVQLPDEEDGSAERVSGVRWLGEVRA